MGTDTARMLLELEMLTSTLLPDEDIVKLKHRYEEVINNYDVNRKTPQNLENDFKEKIDMYLNALRLESYSQITLEGYERELVAFDRYTNKPPVIINTPDVRKYLASNSNWAPGTVSNKLTIIKSFYKWCVDEELLLRNPANKIRPPKQPNRLPKGFSQSEMEQLRQACKGNRDRALVEVFYSTGCRLSEVSNMRTEDIDWQRSSIDVVGKGDKERTVYFNPRAVYHLKRYLQDKEYDENDCEYLFTTSVRPYRQISNRSIEDAFKKIAKRTWIKDSVHPHRFRHTMATQAMESGIELGDLQQLLGHSNPGTTLRYAAVSEERKQHAHKRFVQ